MNTLFGNLVDLSIERLRTFEPPEGYWLAFSGGKDSCVLLDLAERSGVKFDAHYSVISIDPPELLRFIKREFADKGRVKMDIPARPFLSAMVDNGYPTRRRRWCCRVFKEKAGEGRFILTGIRWAESVRRAKRKMTELCNRSGSRYLHPIVDWKNADVWDYIRARGLPTCSLYAEGQTRIGCVGCPNSNDEAWRSRWPHLAAAWRRAFHALYNRRKAQGKEWTAKWSDPDVLFEAWCDHRNPMHGDKAEQDCGLFT